MNLHAVKTVGAVGIGHGALLLLIVDEVALEEDDRGTRHRSACAVAHLALDDATIVEGDIDVPAGNQDRHRRWHHEETMHEKAPPLHPLVAPVVRPRMNSFCA